MKVCSMAGGDLKIMEVMPEKNQFVGGSSRWMQFQNFHYFCGRLVLIRCNAHPYHSEAAAVRKTGIKLQGLALGCRGNLTRKSLLDPASHSHFMEEVRYLASRSRKQCLEGLQTKIILNLSSFFFFKIWNICYVFEPAPRAWSSAFSFRKDSLLCKSLEFSETTVYSEEREMEGN